MASTTYRISENEGKEMNQPKVSIIVPLHNAEQYLHECLNSLVNQTLKEIEIICVDDASTDSSLKILNQYAQSESRLKIISYKENKTASQARKDAVALSSGEFIMFSDADDHYELNACEDLYNLICEHNVDILQYGTFVDAEEGVSKNSIDFFNRFVEPYKNKLNGREVFDFCFKRRKYRFNLWNKIYSAKLCKKAFAVVEDGAFPKAQDLYAFFIIAWYAQSYYGVKTKYYHYNYGRGITGGARKATLDQFRRCCTQNMVADKCKDFLVNQGEWAAYENMWNELNSDLISECVSQWINSVDIDDKEEGFDILIKSWGEKEVRRLLKGKFKNDRELICSYSNSADKLLNHAAIGLVNKTDADIPDGFDRVIPVVFATNDKYSIYAGVAIESIMQHAEDKDYYRFYILHDSLSVYHIESLEGLEYQQAKVKCINIGEVLAEKEATLYERMHFTKEMYYRFVIAEVFPFFEKVIYLDCDLVAISNLGELFSFDLDNRLIAAVRNVTSEHGGKRLEKELNLDPMKYINSGVLLINIVQWNQEKIGEKCFELLRTIPEKKLLYADQDILNIVCNNRILHLGFEWNFYWHMLYGAKDYVEICEEIALKEKSNFKILHFASNIKPWTSPEIPLSKYFWKYARNSAFYEEILSQNFTVSQKSNEYGITSSVKRKNEINSSAYVVHNRDKYNECNNETIGLKNGFTWFLRCSREHGVRYTIHRMCTVHIPEIIALGKYKCRRCYQCYLDHGFLYTVGRVMVRLHLKKESQSIDGYKGFNDRRIDQKKIVKKDYNYYNSLPRERYEEELKEWYKSVTGNDLDLDNPRTFNEKIQWLKLYDSTPKKTRLADKYLVREWISNTIGEEYLVPLLGVWDSFDEIDFDTLPDKFALKTNHGSGWNLIVKDKSKIDKNVERNKFNSWMSKTYAFNYGFELHYLNIPPKIIAEQYIENMNQLYDYKVLCFHGEPKLIWVDSDRFSGHRRTFFDLEWNKLDVQIKVPNSEKEILKPVNLQKMIDFSQKLSNGFAHARIDFYEVEDQLYFGEITFTSSSGTERATPRKFEYELGEMITLPCKSEIPERII